MMNRAPHVELMTRRLEVLEVCVTDQPCPCGLASLCLVRDRALARRREYVQLVGGVAVELAFITVAVWGVLKAIGVLP